MPVVPSSVLCAVCAPFLSRPDTAGAAFAWPAGQQQRPMDVVSWSTLIINVMCMTYVLFNIYLYGAAQASKA